MSRSKLVSTCAKVWSKICPISCAFCSCSWENKFVSMGSWAVSGLAFTFLSYVSVSFHRSLSTCAQNRSFLAKNSCSLRRAISEFCAGSCTCTEDWGPLRVCSLSKSLRADRVCSAFWPVCAISSDTTWLRPVVLTARILSVNSPNSCFVACSSGLVYSWESLLS